jgi:shikimate dehydrogenase
MVVMDTVYRPFHTVFVQEASQSGCIVVSGLEMLLYQGVEQLKYWLDLPAGEDFVIQKMRETLYKAVNVHE